MQRKIKVLLFLISLVSVLNANSVITFKNLTKLASDDVGKNIYLDKDLPEYKVEFNNVDFQDKGQIYEFYKIVLYEHDLKLVHNRRGDFFTIAKLDPKPIKPPEPLEVHEKLKLHYYTYKIKNITNEDVVKSMSIFPSVKFQYLKQSDMIAYSATKEDHNQVTRILNSSDNEVLNKTVKITLFAINKKNITEMGSSINAFNYDLSSTLDGVFQAFRSGGTSQFSLDDTINIGFTLHALEGHSIADIYQQPTIRLTNGMKSTVTSVVNVPYLQTTSTVDSTTNSVIEQYQYKDIGLQINVLPKIKDDWVFIDLDLISEELISLDDDKPITQKITYKNSVKVSKGKPILLTGIKKTAKQLTKDGIPYLSDLPVIGWAFKQKNDSYDEQNINILIEVL